MRYTSNDNRYDYDDADFASHNSANSDQPDVASERTEITSVRTEFTSVRTEITSDRESSYLPGKLLSDSYFDRVFV
jgi:hypothetical protein